MINLPPMNYYRQIFASENQKSWDVLLKLVKNLESGIETRHEYDSVKEDIELWLPKLKKGGLLCGHGFLHPKHPDVKKAVCAILKHVVYHGEYIWSFKNGN